MVIISKNVTLCKNFFRKASGLMFRGKRDDFAFIFPFRFNVKPTITMWFVFFPIDILFLDHENYVVERVEKLCPWKLYVPLRKFRTFIELPAGTIKKHSISLGQRVSWNKKQVQIV